MRSNNICIDRNLRIVVGLSIFVFLLLAGITGATTLKIDNSDAVDGQREGVIADGKPAIVNLQVDLEKEGDQTTVYNILNEIEKRDWRVTVYVTEKFALNHSDVIRDIHYRGHQIAIHAQNDENIANPDYNSQFYSTNKTIKIISDMLGTDQKISHFKPYKYIYSDIENTLKILQNLSILSITGLFGANENPKCSYCLKFENPSQPFYTAYGVAAIPISSLKNNSEEIILDDNLIFNNTNTTDQRYLDYLKRKYDDAYLLEQPMITVVHPSIVGKDEDKLIALIQFLDYIKESTGKVVTSDSIILRANQSISASSIAEDKDPVVSREAMSQSRSIITGKVTRVNGTPVADAYVSASGPGYRTTSTDINGTYTISGLLAGNYLVSVSPPYGSGLISNSTIVQVALDETVTTDIILQVGGIITGNITTNNGNPVANAYVSASGQTYTSTYTDTNGMYRLGGLAAGDYIIRAGPPYGSGLISNSTIVQVALNETVTANITLHLGGVITGNITTMNGNPVANAYVSASGPSHASVYTDVNGMYRLGGLAEGDYIIRADPLYGSDLISNSTIVHVALDETVTANIIVQMGGIITGKITKVNGTPVANTYVSVSGPSHPSVFTDVNGWYRLGGLAAGDYIIHAAAPYGSNLISNSTIVHVALDEKVSVNIILQVGGVITGNIATINGIPVENVHVSVSGPTFGSTYTDTNGMFILEGLYAGNYTVYAEPPYETNLAINYTSIRVAFDEIVNASIILQIGGVITGKITSMKGSPVADAYVSVYGPTARSTYTDMNGRYRLERLSAGDYIIRADPPYGSELISNSTFVGVTYDETVTTDIILKVGGVITGNVTTMNGSPVANSYVSIPNYRSSYTDANGRYRLGGLAAGKYIIYADPPYGSELISNSTFVNITSDETINADIILKEGGVITGNVTTMNGSPVANSYVHITGPTFRSNYTDANGTYRLGGLAAGDYIICADPPTGSELISNTTFVSVTSDETITADIILKEGGVITGKVTSTNGSPVADAYVSGPTYKSNHTDVNGTYRLGGLAAGNYIIRADPPTGSELISNSTFVSVTSNETVTTDIILQVGGVITGNVTTLDGTSMYHTSISAFGPTRGEAYTDANGKYRLGGLPAGNYTVYATYLGSKYSNVSVRFGEISIADIVVLTPFGPIAPVPEIPTVAMVSIGILMLSAMMVFRKK